MVFLLPYTGTSSKQHGRVNTTNLNTVASAAFKQGKLVLFLEQVAVQWMHLSVQYRARNKLWVGGQGVPRLLERLSSQSPRPPYGKHTTQHSNHRRLAEHPDLHACVRALAIWAVYVFSANAWRGQRLWLAGDAPGKISSPARMRTRA